MSSLLAPNHAQRVLTPVRVTHHSTTTNLRALIDSGANESCLADKMGLSSEPLARPIEARAINGREPLIITHTTETLELHTHGHEERMNFYFFTVTIADTDSRPSLAVQTQSSYQLENPSHHKLGGRLCRAL